VYDRRKRNPFNLVAARGLVYLLEAALGVGRRFKAPKGKTQLDHDCNARTIGCLHNLIFYSTEILYFSILVSHVLMHLCYSPKATGQDPMDETSCQDVAQVLVFESPEQNHPPHASPFEPSRAAQCEVASPSSTKQKKSRRHRQRQVVQVGQRIELSEQGREYDKRVWGMLSKGGQGTVTQVNLDQDVCWVLWDSTKQTGAYHSVHFDWMLVSNPS
jgi:hypothetical protein